MKYLHDEHVDDVHAIKDSKHDFVSAKNCYNRKLLFGKKI